MAMMPIRRATAVLVRRPWLVAAAALLVSCTRGATEMNEVTVRGNDYAFDVPRELPSGQTAFAFRNDGAVPHEMIMVLLREGVSLRELMEAQAAGGNPAEFTEGGAAILIADAGETAGSRVVADLLPGRTYALVCNFRDGPGQPPHTQLGMLAAIEVSAR